MVGGGSLGCQTLYHLAKQGVTNTVLLEKAQLHSKISKIHISEKLFSKNSWRDLWVFGKISCSFFSLQYFANFRILWKAKLTAGTTWHTAGLVWRLRPSDVEIQLLDHMQKIVNSLGKKDALKRLVFSFKQPVSVRILPIPRLNILDFSL